MTVGVVNCVAPTELTHAVLGGCLTKLCVLRPSAEPYIDGEGQGCIPSPSQLCGDLRWITRMDVIGLLLMMAEQYWPTAI
jgi:hypothetical protein